MYEGVGAPPSLGPSTDGLSWTTGILVEGERQLCYCVLEGALRVKRARRVKAGAMAESGRGSSQEIQRYL